MKKIGMIGGMSWENTIEYYTILNQRVKEKLGGWNSAKIILYSVNFAEILPLEEQGRWDEITDRMLDISRSLERAGASALVICSNTMHKIAPNLESHLSIPLLHVVDATAETITSQGVKTIGLLGTKFTMEEGFYTNKLAHDWNLSVVLPEKEERDYLHHVIYNELAQGDLKDSTKHDILNIIRNLKTHGAEGIILGCTELPLLIQQSDVEIPLFDTLKLHLEKAVDFALSP